MNFDVGKTLYKLSKLGGGGKGNLDKIQKEQQFFLVRPSLSHLHVQCKVHWIGQVEGFEVRLDSRPLYVKQRSLRFWVRAGAICNTV